MSEFLDGRRYAGLVMRASAAAIALAAALILIKTYVWMFTNSVTLLASVTDSAMDLAASLINWFALRFSLKPADSDHNYGHAKAEALAGLAQCAFIAASSLFLIAESVNRIFNPAPLENMDAGLWVMAVSTVLTAAVVAYQTSVVRRTGSQIIAADRLHCRSDLYSNAAIILSLALSMYGWTWADVAFATLIALYIASGAASVGMKSLDILLDKRLPGKMVRDIEELLKSPPGVVGVHDLRTRRTGNSIFVQAHVCIDGNLSLREAHAIAAEAKKAVLFRYVQADIIIHADPAGPAGV